MSLQPQTRVIGVTAEDARGTQQTVVFNKEFYDASPISPARDVVKQGNLAGRKTRYAPNYVGTEAGTATIMTDFKGSGLNATEPKIGEILKSAGFWWTEDISGTLDGYVMDGTLPCSTMTYQDSVYQCGTAPKGSTEYLIGAVPVVTISSEGVGKPLKLSAELTGGYLKDAVDETTLYAVSGADATNCLKFVGGVYTIGGTSIDIKTFEFTSNAEVAMETDPTKSNGTLIKHHHISDLRGRTLTLGYTKPLKSVKDFDAEFSSETIYTEIVLQFLSESGETCDITFTLPQASEWSDENADSYVITNATFDVDEVSIVFDVV